MSTQSRIEWTEQTWNPTVGCTKVSPGCKHCYAETMAKRLQAMGVRGYENGFRLTLMSERLAEPLERRKPTVYFVNSMSDLFHEKVPFDYIRQRQCDEAEAAFFFKQWGAWGVDGQKRTKKANGRTYRGKIYDSMPNIVPAIA